MAGYAIAGVPFTDFYGQDNPDYRTVAFTSYDLDWNGTPSNPKTFYEGNGGYIKGYKSGNTGYVPYQRMNGSTLTGTGLRSLWGELANEKLYMYAYSPNNSHQVIVRYSFNSSVDGFLDRVVNGPWTTDDILYTNSYENAEGQGILEYTREWDESPTENREGDPNNMLPNGGAYADTEAFDTTNNISIFEMDEPAEMSYGKLISAIVLHEDASQGYNLTQLNNCLFLADFWTNLRNKFEGLSDPLSMIISTIELPYTPATSGTQIMKLGGVEVLDNDGIPILVNKIGQRYEQRQLGSVTLKEVWGTEKDYTQCSIEMYLPYVGCREIDVDLAVNYTLTIYATVDRWTGDILYRLHASNSTAQNKYMTSEFVAYRWSGNCAKNVPLGKVDNTSAILSLLGMPAKAITGTVAGGIAGGALATGGAILNMDLSPIVQSSGSVSGSVGRMDLQYPYLIIKRAIPSYPNDWRSKIGATRNQTFNISALTGFTLFSTVFLENIECMAEEKEELERLLTTEGVIL